MKPAASTLLIFALLATGFAMPSRAAACDRPSVRPWERFGRADLVVRAQVEEVPAAGPVRVRITETLVGRSAAPTLAVTGFARGDGRMRCGGTPPAVGDALLLFLYEPRGSVTHHELIDEVDGALPAASPQAAELTKLVKERASTAFADAGPGLAVKLFASSPRVRPGTNVDLAVLVRNVGPAPLTFSWRDWPREKAAACRLTVTRAGAGLPPQRNPISDADIEAYFSKHGRTYELPLVPGQAHEVLLSRFHTAAPGWGYKEELDFQFHPLEQPGTYSIAATCRNLPAGGRGFETPKLELVVPAPATP